MIQYARKAKIEEEREATSTLNAPCTRHCCINHDTVRWGGAAFPCFTANCLVARVMLSTRGGKSQTPPEVSGKPLWVHCVWCLCVPRSAPSFQPAAHKTTLSNPCTGLLQLLGESF